MDHENGPPIKEVGPGANTSPGTNLSESEPRHAARSVESNRFDDLRARGRRRAAAVRSAPISSCSCNIRDPEVDKHRCGSGITDKQADGAVAAAQHLAAAGIPGLFDVELCRAMFRRGHHQLAVRCFQYREAS